MLCSDNWIRQQCECPTHLFQFAEGGQEYASEPLSERQQHIKANYEMILELSRYTGATPGMMFQKGRDSIYQALTAEQRQAWKPMIAPFSKEQVKIEEGTNRRIVSWGLSSYGYDVRLGNKFKIFTNINNGVIDPLAMDSKCYVDFEGDECIIPPNSYILGHTIEYFCIPRNVAVVCLGKSTYARAGALVNVTPIEPGFEGEVVIEISNGTNLPLKVHANQGIAQFMFFKGEDPCVVSYADRAGKYQGQRGVVTARV